MRHSLNAVDLRKRQSHESRQRNEKQTGRLRKAAHYNGIHDMLSFPDEFITRKRDLLPLDPKFPLRLFENRKILYFAQ